MRWREPRWDVRDGIYVRTDGGWINYDTNAPQFARCEVNNVLIYDVDTAFGIGSCSKAFTSALAAALVDGRKLGWDDPIKKYLPSFQLYDPWISDRVTSPPGSSRLVLSATLNRSMSLPFSCSSSNGRPAD